MATEPPAFPARLAVCDDHPLVADAVRRILEPAYAIVGAAASGVELIALLGATDVDLLLLDLSLPDVSGLELLEAVRKAYPRVRILVLTMFQDRVLADACLQSGADGFIPKTASADELRGAVAEILPVAGMPHHASPRPATAWGSRPCTRVCGG